MRWSLLSSSFRAQQTSWNHVEGIPRIFTTLSTSIHFVLFRPTKGLIISSHRRWKISQAMPENPSSKPNPEQYDEICEGQYSRDKITKFLEMHSSCRLYTDWCMTVAAEKARKKMQIAMSSQQLWQSITNQLTENITLKHF